MILRELNNKLYEITLPTGITEDEFLEKQKNGTVKFLQVAPDQLPTAPEDEQRHFSKVFYELNGKNIVIDYERTVEQWLNDKYIQIEDFIYSKYSQGKQASDQADKEYFSTLLKAKGIENLEAEIVVRVQNFFAGSTLNDVVSDIADEDKEAFIQLIKTGIRVTWVQMCKQELKKAIAENIEPAFPEYPL